MYDIAAIAADISREFKTPVAILASGILTHSEGLVKTKEQRTIIPKGFPKDMSDWMCFLSLQEIIITSYPTKTPLLLKHGLRTTN